MGDFLNARASIELVQIDDLEPLRVFARVTNAMTIGEMRQLEAHDKPAYGEEEDDELSRAKTGSLLAGAGGVGGMRAPNAVRGERGRFGVPLRVRFAPG